MVLEATASEMNGKTARMVRRIASLLRYSSPGGITVIMPVFRQKHWSLVLATISQGHSVLRVFDSLPTALGFRLTTEESRNRLSELLEFDQGTQQATTESFTPGPVSTWPAQEQDGIKQVNSDDCGVAVILHAAHALARVSVPSKTDWTLWRRVISAFLEALDDIPKEDDDGGGAPKRATLEAIRQHHNRNLGLTARPQIQVEMPERLKALTTARMTDLETATELGNIIGNWQDDIRESQQKVSKTLRNNCARARATIKQVRRLTAGFRKHAKVPSGAEGMTAEDEVIVKNIAGLRKALVSVEAASLDEIASQLTKEISVLEAEKSLLEARRSDEVRRYARSIEALQAIDDEVDMLEDQLAESDY
ncbi:hypothetical protein EsH8_XII_000042 [Colletotrichum jinshuiense]